MQCPDCKEELRPEETHCSRCGREVVEVKVLRPEERDNFRGMTLSQGEETTTRSEGWTGREGNYEYRSEGPGHRVYVRQVSFGSGGVKPFGFLTKLLIAALVLFLLFVALPLALLVAAVFSLVWWLMRR